MNYMKDIPFELRQSLDLFSLGAFLGACEAECTVSQHFKRKSTFWSIILSFFTYRFFLRIESSIDVTLKRIPSRGEHRKWFHSLVSEPSLQDTEAMRRSKTIQMTSMTSFLLVFGGVNILLPSPREGVGIWSSIRLEEVLAIRVSRLR